MESRSTVLFHVVLHQPLIPNNTGNIGRTCVATGCMLHLVRPLGFELSAKACRRAGLDYWPRLALRVHDSWEAFLHAEGLSSPSSHDRVWLFSGEGGRNLFDARVRRGDWLIFGNEVHGLPADVLEAWPARVLHLPMLPGERSLNLATVVCAAVYEGVRQLLAQGEIGLDPAGRLVPDPAGYTAPTRV